MLTWFLLLLFLFTEKQNGQKKQLVTQFKKSFISVTKYFLFQLAQLLSDSHIFIDKVNGYPNVANLQYGMAILVGRPISGCSKLNKQVNKKEKWNEMKLHLKLSWVVNDAFYPVINTRPINTSFWSPPTRSQTSNTNSRCGSRPS